MSPLTQHNKSRSGYATVGLWRPKNAVNVGAILRAASAYRASAVVIGRGRTEWIRSHADPQSAWTRIPVTTTDDLRTAIPFDCRPIAVDLIPGAQPLHTYEHPVRGFYIFGPEDGTLGRDITAWCQDVIYVPTDGSMNLAACVNVVLYDRAVKRGEFADR